MSEEKKIEVMSDEKWNAWANPVLEWCENMEQNLEDFAGLEDANYDADEMELAEGTIRLLIKKATDNPTRRIDNKDRLQKSYRHFVNWPHTGRGPQSSLSREEQGGLDKVCTVERLAALAYWNVYVEHGAEHTLVQNASRKNQTNGVRYPNGAAFANKSVASRKAQVRGFIKSGEWGATDEEGNALPFDFNHPIVRVPLPPKDE